MYFTGIKDKIITRTSTFMFSCLQAVLVDSLMTIDTQSTDQSVAQHWLTTHELFTPCSRLHHKPSSSIPSLRVENGAINLPPPSYFVSGCNLSLTPGLKSEMFPLFVYCSTPCLSRPSSSTLAFRCPRPVQSSDFCVMAFLKHDLTTSIAWFLLAHQLSLYLTFLLSPRCWSSLASRPSGFSSNTYAGRHLAWIHPLWSFSKSHNRKEEWQLHWF